MVDDRIEVDVAVVGAGPVGLISAIALADAGASVALIAPPLPPDDLRTTALLSGSVEFLEKLGIWAADKAAPLSTMRLVDGTRRLIRSPEIAFHASELNLAAFGYNIANADLTASLAAHVAARGVLIRRIEAPATSVTTTDTHAEVTVAGGTTLRARLVIGADGRGSLVREAAGIAVKRWDYPQTALVVNLDHTGPHYDTSTEFHTETGPFTLVPLSARRSSLVCVEKPDVAAKLDAMDDAALALELERRAHSILGRFTIASRRQSWPMSGLKAAAMSARRVALVGEAGHAFPPIGAQGMNLGIRDIIALADLIRRVKARGEDVGSASVTERYARDRRADVTSRSFGVDLLNRSLLTGFLPVQMARSAVLHLARDVNPIRKLLMREGLRPQLFQSL